MPIFTHLKIYRVDTQLSYMNKRNQEIESKILEINININEYQTNIVYKVETDNDVICFVKNNIMATNLDIVIRKNVLDQIPNGFYEINSFNVIKKTDRIALVSIDKIKTKTFKVSWIKPDDSEIGKTKQQYGLGAIIIRPYRHD